MQSCESEQRHCRMGEDTDSLHDRSGTLARLSSTLHPLLVVPFRMPSSSSAPTPTSRRKLNRNSTASLALIVSPS